MTQTKLTPEQKQDLRDYRADNPGTIVVHLAPWCLMLRPTGEGPGEYEFTAARRGEGEKKYRRKVGEFLCYQRAGIKLRFSPDPADLNCPEAMLYELSAFLV